MITDYCLRDSFMPLFGKLGGGIYAKETNKEGGKPFLYSHFD